MKSPRKFSQSTHGSGRNTNYTTNFGMEDSNGNNVKKNG